MSDVKTHTFKNGKYKIDIVSRIDGMTDIPCGDHCDDSSLEMLVLSGNDFKALHSAIHEAMHAHGIPSKYIHDKGGYANTWSLVKFIWRLGWRKIK